MLTLSYDSIFSRNDMWIKWNIITSVDQYGKYTSDNTTNKPIEQMSQSKLIVLCNSSEAAHEIPKCVLYVYWQNRKMHIYHCEIYVRYIYNFKKLAFYLELLDTYCLHSHPMDNVYLLTIGELMYWNTIKTHGTFMLVGQKMEQAAVMSDYYCTTWVHTPPEHLR